MTYYATVRYIRALSPRKYRLNSFRTYYFSNRLCQRYRFRSKKLRRKIAAPVVHYNRRRTNEFYVSGQVIKAVRERLQMSQQDLATRAKVPVKLIQSIEETSTANWTLSTMNSVSNALGLDSPAQLMVKIPAFDPFLLLRQNRNATKPHLPRNKRPRKDCLPRPFCYLRYYLQSGLMHGKPSS